MQTVLMEYPKWESIRAPEGRLTWDYENREWLVTASPPIVTFVTRMFPGAKVTKTEGASLAKFSVTWRTFPDLMIVLHKYQLTVEDEEEFDGQWSRCVFQTQQRDLAVVSLDRQPPPTLQRVADSGKLKPYQIDGVKWMMANRRTLLADEMGLGKTVQSLAFLAAANGWPALVVCENNVVRQWAYTAIPQWLPGVRVAVLSGQKPYPIPEACPIVVIPYHLLSYWSKALCAYGFKSVVYDEIQSFRRHDSDKTISGAAISSSGGIENIIGLSGTPIYNYGIETWSVFNAIEPGCLGSRDQFIRDWCEHDRVRDPEFLGRWLRDQGLMQRRTKDQVKLQLPPKRRLVESIDANQKFAPAAELIARARKAAELAEVAEERDRSRLEQSAQAIIRHATGMAKAPAVAAFCLSLLQMDIPLVVFAHHKDVIAYLHQQLLEYRPGRIVGDADPKERDAAIRNFVQEERANRSECVLVSLRAGATGLDGLQKRGRVVVFAELDWTPAIHEQAEGRLDRIGQTGTGVDVYYLVSDFGSDPVCQTILGIKRSQFDGLVGNKFNPAEAEAQAAALRSQLSDMVKRMARRGA